MKLNVRDSDVRSIDTSPYLNDAKSVTRFACMFDNCSNVLKSQKIHYSYWSRQRSFAIISDNARDVVIFQIIPINHVFLGHSNPIWFVHGTDSKFQTPSTTHFRAQFEESIPEYSCKTCSRYNTLISTICGHNE